MFPLSLLNKPCLDNICFQVIICRPSIRIFCPVFASTCQQSAQQYRVCCRNVGSGAGRPGSIMNVWLDSSTLSRQYIYLPYTLSGHSTVCDQHNLLSLGFATLHRLGHLETLKAVSKLLHSFSQLKLTMDNKRNNEVSTVYSFPVLPDPNMRAVFVLPVL